MVPRDNLCVNQRVIAAYFATWSARYELATSDKIW